MVDFLLWGTIGIFVLILNRKTKQAEELDFNFQKNEFLKNQQFEIKNKIIINDILLGKVQ